jgi:molecular chaperone GrpE (heat shock protein)
MTEDNLEKPADSEIKHDEIDEEAAAGEGEAAAEEGGDPENVSDARDCEIEDLKNQLATARAELYNYRQRMERERAKSRKLIAEDKTAEFLPVLDNLDRALCVPEDGSAKDVLVGVRMVQRQFLSILENSDVTVIAAEGRPFDPLLHDAVETEFVDDPEQNGLVLSELMRGYRTPERVLRPAQVRVASLNPRSGGMKSE